VVGPASSSSATPAAEPKIDPFGGRPASILRASAGWPALARGAWVQRDLVDRAKRGDEEAFDALARQVGDDCMAIASWILRDADPSSSSKVASRSTSRRATPGCTRRPTRPIERPWISSWGR